MMVKACCHCGEQRKALLRKRISTVFMKLAKEEKNFRLSKETGSSFVAALALSGGVLSAAIHELGHAGAAKLAGGQVV